MRSILEQSCVVWHSSLTQENSEDLERIQKAAIRIINGKHYENYEEALEKADLESLEKRREQLSKQFAKKSMNSENIRANDMFPEKQKEHQMNLRKEEEYKVDFANTNRLQKSSIPYMQRLLNIEEQLIKEQNSKKRKNKCEKISDRKRRKPG